MKVRLRSMRENLNNLDIAFFEFTVEKLSFEEIYISSNLSKHFSHMNPNALEIEIKNFLTKSFLVDKKNIIKTKGVLKISLQNSEKKARLYSFHWIKKTNKNIDTYYANILRANNNPEENLLNNTGFIKTTVDIMPAIFYAKDTDGRFLMVNKLFRELFQLTDDKLIGKTNHEIFPKDIADQFRENDLKTISEASVTKSTEVADGSNGDRRTYQSYKFPYIDENKKVYATGGISVDITELIESERKLQDSLKILEMNNEILDLSSSKIDLKEKASSMINIFQKQDWIPKKSGLAVYKINNSNKLEVLAKKNLPGSFNNIRFLQEKYKICKLAPSNKLMELYTNNGKKDQGNTYPTHYCVPIRFKREIIGSIFICLPDDYEPEERHKTFLTAFSRAAEDLVIKTRTGLELEKQKRIMLHNAKLASIGELAAGIGHEINNPLAILTGYVETLVKRFEEEDNLDKKEFDKYIDKISKSSKRITAIVQSLRTFSRADTDDIEEFCIIEALEESISMVSEIFQRQGVKIEYKHNLKSSNTYITGNRGRMQQVLMNLFANARDATEGQSERLISIKVESSNKILTIHVEDNGQGIEKGIEDKIFDPFFTTKDLNKGTGIGLSLVHNIIKEHNGEVYALNTDFGCRFSIEIPLVN